MRKIATRIKNLAGAYVNIVETHPDTIRPAEYRHECTGCGTVGRRPGSRASAMTDAKENAHRCEFEPAEN